MEKAKEFVTKVTDKVIAKAKEVDFEDKRVLVAATAAATLAAASAVSKVFSCLKSDKPTYRDDHVKNRPDFYDVVIVGGGPSGSTCGYFLAKEDVKVAVLEKKTFPREKYCGDAVCLMAQRILKEMGVLQEIIAEGKACFAQSGGIVSPKGYSFIGNSAAELQMGDEGVACAIKRQYLDTKVAHNARKAGVDLKENNKVVEALFDHYTGTWLIKCEDDQDASKKYEYRARILVCADGSTSALARQLGIVEGEPQAVCSRQYVTKGTHAFKDDGVCFYPDTLLPGYVALFREADGDCNFLTYIIPGGPTKNDQLKETHEALAKNDPFISKALGPNFEGEPMRAAPLRLGGVPKSYDRHCLVIGDAAGMIDPLSGEGIHHSMHSGKVAAKVLAEAIKKQDFSERQLKKYQTIWEADFAADFHWSRVACSLLVKYPWVLDAAAIVIKKKGGKFLTDWAQVMTGSKSKFWLLRPDVAGPFAWEILLESMRTNKSK